MTVPPYVLACIGIVSGAWLAARTGRRAPFIICSAVVAILGMLQLLEVFFPSNRFSGYIILLTTKTCALSL
jgi:MFS transporter, ACS family, DAL5 transporter family protein